MRIFELVVVTALLGLSHVYYVEGCRGSLAYLLSFFRARSTVMLIGLLATVVIFLSGWLFSFLSLPISAGAMGIIIALVCSISIARSLRFKQPRQVEPIIRRLTPKRSWVALLIILIFMVSWSLFLQARKGISPGVDMPFYIEKIDAFSNNPHSIRSALTNSGPDHLSSPYPPFCWALTNAIFALGGISPLTIYSLTFAIMASLTCIFTYLLGERIFGHTAGIVAAFVVSVSPFMVRMSSAFFLNMMGLPFLLGAFYLLCKSIETRANRWAAVGGILGSLAILFHYYWSGIFLGLILVGYSIWLVASRRHPFTSSSVGASLIIFVVFLLLFSLPLAFFLARQGGASLVFRQRGEGLDAAGAVKAPVDPGRSKASMLLTMGVWNLTTFVMAGFLFLEVMPFFNGRWVKHRGCDYLAIFLLMTTIPLSFIVARLAGVALAPTERWVLWLVVPLAIGFSGGLQALLNRSARTSILTSATVLLVIPLAFFDGASFAFFFSHPDYDMKSSSNFIATEIPSHLALNTSLAGYYPIWLEIITHHKVSEGTCQDAKSCCQTIIGARGPDGEDLSIHKGAWSDISEEYILHGLDKVFSCRHMPQ